MPDGWNDVVTSVTLVSPDNQTEIAECKFSLAHYNLSDPEAIPDRRWRIVPTLLDRSYPIESGTIVLGSHELARRLGLPN